ncbi:protein-L-isoaspartate(D-aspartate) O-methyltransferase-like isoform X2 [Artemia franciscana]|uniref:Protein-L-isoaspartate O-methyltransferase n=1 Tax=Artemia franciscana TaxID=6661 RepID=A0AA88L949_ARTSF|nr:hypothetical protein QYM36_003264 [Artemia franciscana]
MFVSRRLSLVLSQANKRQKFPRMFFMTQSASNDELIDALKRQKVVKHEDVERAMRSVDRGFYCPSNAYFDAPESIGYGATISAPHMHAYALELLRDQLKPGAKVLDVGSGSGYLTMCFAKMVGPNGKVVGIDHIPALVNSSIENVRRDCPEYLENGLIKLVAGDGRKGFLEEAPYDAIHVGAAAEEGVPPELLRQLAPKGRMIIPVGPTLVGQELEQIDKDINGHVHRKMLMGVRFVPLCDKDSQLPL